MFATLMEKIRAGYAKSGMKPTRGMFFKDNCCCPLSALAISEGMRDYGHCHDTLFFLDKKMSYPWEWLRCFWRGVDDAGDEFSMRHAKFFLRADQLAGYSMGLEVAYELGLAERQS